MEALWKLQSGVINSCTNTHNNFNSTDKSGINSTTGLLTEDITMIYFQDRKFPVIWQVYWNRLLNGCQSWNSLNSVWFPTIGCETTLPYKDDYYFILTFISVAMLCIFANIVRSFELLLLKWESCCISSSVKRLTLFSALQEYWIKLLKINMHFKIMFHCFNGMFLYLKITGSSLLVTST